MTITAVVGGVQTSTASPELEVPKLEEPITDQPPKGLHVPPTARERFFHHHWRELTITGAYMSHRERFNDRSYVTGQGGWIAGSVESIRYQRSKLSVNFGYRGHVYEQTLTPTTDVFEGGANDSSMVASSPLARPSQVDYQLGAAHRLSMGVSLHKLLNDDSSSPFYAELSGGVVYSRHTFNQLNQGETSSFTKAEKDWSPWLCLHTHYSWLWMSIGYEGDSCIGYREATLRALLGLKIGRASIGVGWGSVIQNTIERLKDGGVIGSLWLPISAPLYLEMSVWSPKRSALRDVIGIKLNERSTSFSVGIKWTGEEYSGELKSESPKQDPKTSPNALPSPLSPHQSMPQNGPSQTL